MASEYSGAPTGVQNQHCVRDERRWHAIVYYDHLDLWSDPKRDLNTSALAVYICLIRHAGWISNECFPSLDTIASEMRISRPTIVKAIKALTRNGLIAVRKVRVPGGYERSIYSLLDKPKPAPSGQSNGFTEGERNFQARSKNDAKPSKDSLPKLEPTEQDTSGDQKKSEIDLPENGPAQKIVKAYCIAMGISKPTNYGRAVGQAQMLADVGITPEEMPNLLKWLREDPFWTKKGVDLGTAVSAAEKWQGRKQQPADEEKLVL